VHLYVAGRSSMSGASLRQAAVCPDDSTLGEGTRRQREAEAEMEVTNVLDGCSKQSLSL
jgi:hypothetical protein